MVGMGLQSFSRARTLFLKKKKTRFKPFGYRRVKSPDRMKRSIMNAITQGIIYATFYSTIEK